MSAYGVFDDSIVRKLNELAKYREFQDSLERGAVFLINDEAMEFTSRGRHFWFVLNKEPKKDDLIVIASGTSQNTPFAIANNSKDPKRTHAGILTLTSKDYAPLNKETHVNCNQCRPIPKLILQQKYIDNKIELCSPIKDSSVVDRLVNCYEVGDSSEIEILKLLK